MDISPWQLYHNSKYQISFYYPKDWNVEHLPTALDGETHQDNIFEIGPNDPESDHDGIFSLILACNLSPIPQVGNDVHVVSSSTVNVGGLPGNLYLLQFIALSPGGGSDESGQATAFVLSSSTTPGTSCGLSLENHAINGTFTTLISSIRFDNGFDAFIKNLQESGAANWNY